MLREYATATVLLAALSLAGCQTNVAQQFPLTRFKAERMLDSGIREYDDGDYKVAARTIQEALDAGLTARSQGRARKYLAFMHCVTGQQAQCRYQFRRALEADPQLELSAAEAGHPTWGPVFQSVKASMARS